MTKAELISKEYDSWVLNKAQVANVIDILWTGKYSNLEVAKMFSVNVSVINRILAFVVSKRKTQEIVRAQYKEPYKAEYYPKELDIQRSQNLTYKAEELTGQELEIFKEL